MNRAKLKRSFKNYEDLEALADDDVTVDDIVTSKPAKRLREMSNESSSSHYWDDTFHLPSISDDGNDMDSPQEHITPSQVSRLISPATSQEHVVVTPDLTSSIPSSDNGKSYPTFPLLEPTKNNNDDDDSERPATFALQRILKQRASNSNDDVHWDVYHPCNEEQCDDEPSDTSWPNFLCSDSSPSHRQVDCFPSQTTRRVSMAASTASQAKKIPQVTEAADTVNTLQTAFSLLALPSSSVLKKKKKKTRVSVGSTLLNNVT